MVETRISHGGSDGAVENMERKELSDNTPFLRQGDFVPRMGAGCLVLVGGLISIIAVTYFFSEHSSGLYGLAFYGLIGLGFGVSGVFWLRYITTLESARRNMFAEKAVLAAAFRHGGTATLAQITLESPLTLNETESAVERLCRRGVARPELMDDGTITYRFSGLIDHG